MNRGLELPLTVLPTASVLRQLREWTADHLEDARIDRLYFNKEGKLTVEGICSSEKDLEAIKKQLKQILADDPQMRGKVRVDDILRGLSLTEERDGFVFVVFRRADEPDTEPDVDIRVRPGLTNVIRSIVQQPIDPRDPPVPRSWDGVLIRRGYYTPAGKYGLDGLVDSAQQQKALGLLLEKLSSRAEGKAALAGGWELTRLNILPVAPLLRRLRLLLPAYPIFDGLAIDSACHDRAGALVLRVVQVGGDGEGGGAALLQRQMLEDKHARPRAPLWCALSGDSAAGECRRRPGERV